MTAESELVPSANNVPANGEAPQKPNGRGVRVLNERKSSVLSPPDQAFLQLIDEVGDRYDLRANLPPNVPPGVSFPVAMSLAYSIERYTTENGRWEMYDINSAFEATKGLLSTAGPARSQHVIQAILNGITGDTREIVGRIVGSDTDPKLQKSAEKLIRLSQKLGFDDVKRLIKDENSLERKLTQLVNVQSKFALDPGCRMKVLEMFLNLNKDERPIFLTSDISIPAEVLNAMSVFSPFDLENMRTLDGLIIKWQKWVNTPMQVAGKKAEIDMFKQRMYAAGQNATTIMGVLIDGGPGVVIKSLGTGTGIVAGAIAAGAMSFGNELKIRVKEQGLKNELNNQRAKERNRAIIEELERARAQGGASE